jgi:hypothetical protein
VSVMCHGCDGQRIGRFSPPSAQPILSLGLEFRSLAISRHPPDMNFSEINSR